jgi:hypothetical protein
MMDMSRVIATKDNNTYYIGTSNGMLEWNRSTNTTNFLDFKDPDGQSVFKDFEVTSIALDDKREYMGNRKRWFDRH